MVDCSIHFEITTKARILNRDKDSASLLFPGKRYLDERIIRLKRQLRKMGGVGDKDYYLKYLPGRLYGNRKDRCGKVPRPNAGERIRGNG